MRDIMLHGVFNMPLPEYPADIDLITWVQFKSRAREASARIEALTAENENLHSRIEALMHDDTEMRRKLAQAVWGLRQTNQSLHEIEAGNMSTFEAQDIINSTIATIKGDGQ